MSQNFFMAGEGSTGGNTVVSVISNGQGIGGGPVSIGQVVRHLCALFGVVVQLAQGDGRENASQVWPTGEMMRSMPCALTRTFLTPSGNRASAGRRTACERLLVKTVVMLMVGSQRDMATVYGVVTEGATRSSCDRCSPFFKPTGEANESHIAGS
jgi:hypothetical protein